LVPAHYKYVYVGLDICSGKELRIYYLVHILLLWLEILYAVPKRNKGKIHIDVSRENNERSIKPKSV